MAENNPDQESVDKLGLSFGGLLVGLAFNPAGNKKVQRLKEIFAEAANIVNEDAIERKFNANHHSLNDLVLTNAEQQILNAQMAAVKSVTLGL